MDATFVGMENDRTHSGSCALRHGLIAFGWLNVALGAIGVVVPGLPTTVFLLIALWAFSKSSERFRLWLYDHKIFGPPIRDWHEHRVIPPRAKFMALAMMSLSVAGLAVFVASSALLPVLVASAMAPVAIFIVTRPSRPLIRTSR
jgi:uncharacterized protein